MKRRAFLATVLVAPGASPLLAAVRGQRWDEAAEILQQATAKKQVDAAVLHVVRRQDTLTRHFGAAASGDAMFLLGSISKPINVAAVMTLFDQGKFQLDDRVQKFLPQFKGERRADVTIRHLLTHASGLPDQLPANGELRKRQAPLEEFVEQALRTPLGFQPGTRYQYSSMGILLACRIGEVLSGKSIHALVDRQVFRPLGMKHSAQGLGRFRLEDMVPCQMEGAAPESGSGDLQAREWDWNSPYWRKLGAPWGGTHASAPDVGRFLDEFLHARGQVVRPETARLMIRNHNPEGFTPRGLGFDVGRASGSPGCSDQTFGHTGSTGTLCWADPASDTVCVVLTSLPRRAVSPHPRERAAERVAAAARH
jgi:CubicO group peptidase (beta-lactamase class C family)